LDSGIRPQNAGEPPDFETEGRERTARTVPKESRVISVLTGETCVEKLAQLFPNVSPMRIPVRITHSGPAGRRLQEQTVIEFGTAREVIFSSSLPLEFEDRLQLLNSDRSLDARATVVAVRYHEGRKAVAARFLGEVGNWIIKP
jgi:hypothetical protein